MFELAEKRASEAGEGEGAGSVLSPETGIVVDIRINLRETGGKPTLFNERKAAVPNATNMKSPAAAYFGR